MRRAPASAGYDAAGYADLATLATAADSLGAFSFRRPEDVSVNPANGTQAVFATTGINGSSNHDGTIYTIAVDFTQIDNPAGAISVLYNANLDAAGRIRNPDNVDWADDGRIYVQEDRATDGLFGSGAVNGHEASILRIDPETAAILRVAAIDRAAVPFGTTDGAAADVGNWESSGILDVSALFGSAPGTLFLADVQAHSVVDGGIAENGLAQGGQLLLLAAPGADHLPAVSRTEVDGVGRVIGSRFADTIIGDDGANRLFGRGGGDRIDGGGGKDILRGGGGADLLIDTGGGRDHIDGGRGRDTIVGGGGRDVMAGGKGRDVFAFKTVDDMGLTGGSRDRIKDFHHGIDMIDLSAIDANGAAAGDAAFSLLHGRQASFTGAGAELRWYQADHRGDRHDKTIVAGDVNGDGKADFKIELTGLIHLSAADFLL